jgi:hypothetical protein
MLAWRSIRPLVTFLLLTAALILFTQQSNAQDEPAKIKIIEVKRPNGQILSYRYLGGATEVTMRGTSAAPDARIQLKVGSRPGFVELDINRGQISGLKPASQFGGDFLTYVLWAVSVDGKAANLGEITFLNDKPISINVTTPYQTFWLMLTAEPDYAVVDPSPVVVLYSAREGPNKEGKTALTVPGNLFFYTHYTDYRGKPAKPDSSPNVLLQARKAVELASKSGILNSNRSSTVTESEEEQRSRKALAQARDFLARAESSYKDSPEGSDVVQFSRTAAQIAENARALALGAVGGALVSRLEREVKELRGALTNVQQEPPARSIESSPKPGTPAKIPLKARLANMAAELVSTPVTWFGVAGWLLALLLLFRRRTA